MKFNLLNKTDTLFYKGIAIFMIVIHNFMHLFPSPKEMEFQFYDDRFEIFLYSLNEPSEYIRILFSYLGHFGVQVFVFLSAYGLAKRYEEELINFSQYMFKRIITIYPSFLLAIVLFMFIGSSWEHGALSPLKEMYWDINLYVNKVLMISNFIPGQELSLVGPWWFLSFIFQFYIIFPFLLKLYKSWGNISLLVLSIASITLNMVLNGKIGDLNLYFTVLGHLPEFCLGIYFAKKDPKSLSLSNWTVFVAAIIFIVGNMYNIFWHVNHLSFLILLLFSFNYINNRVTKTGLLYRFFLYLGTISMPLFLVNGFLREPFISMAQEYNVWLATIGLCLLSFVTSVIVSVVLQKSEQYLLLSVAAIKTKCRTKEIAD